MLAGFLSLPSGVQATILSLVRQATPQTRADDVDDLALVSHAFEAHDYLAAVLANSVDEISSTSTRARRQAAQLPYLLRLQKFGGSVTWSRYLCSLLIAQQVPMPQLASLTLTSESRDLPAVASALSSLTQLTALRFATSNSPGQPHAAVSTLRPCPLLCDLSLTFHVLQYIADVPYAWLPLALSYLSSLTALTHLTVSTPYLCNYLLSAGQDCAVLWPVSQALPLLIALQSLELRALVFGQHAEPCWQVLAATLPMLPRLTTLSLHFGPRSHSSTAACLQTLSTGLSCLTRLRSLTLCGEEQLHQDDDIIAFILDAARQAASEQLARAIGALTGLETLQLCGNLEGIVSAHDCYMRLGWLTALRSLGICNLGLWLPLARQGNGDGGDALVGLLAGMMRLVSLMLKNSSMSEPAASAVLSSAVPALPALQYLEVWADPHEERRHVPLLLLAAKMREGRLLHLRNVA